MRSLPVFTFFAILSICPAAASSGSVYISLFSTTKNTHFQTTRVDEYIFLITDARDKQLITTALVKIKNSKGHEIEAKVNPKTGEWKALLDQTENYFVSIQAPGYIGTEMEIDAIDTSRSVKTVDKLISISLKKNDSAILSLIAIDAITNETIPATFKILRPEESTLTGESNKVIPYRIEFSQKKKFSVEVSAEGYKTISEQLSFDNIKSEPGDNKTLLKKFILKRETYNFLFKIIDAQTGENIINTRMRIINLRSKQSIAAKIEKDGFSANLSPESEYSVEVYSDGYDQTLQNVDLKQLLAKGKFDQEILLLKKSEDRYRLIVVDEETNKNVPRAALKIFNAKNEAVTLQTTAVQSEWLANLKIAGDYTAEVTSPGYLTYKAPLVKNDKTLYLKITKVPLKEIHFVATDFYTKQILLAQYKVMSGANLIESSSNPEKNRFKAFLKPDENYQLEIVSDGYPVYQETVNQNKAVDHVIMITLKKNGYIFTFNAIDAQTREQVLNAQINLVAADNSNQALPIVNRTSGPVSPQDFEKKYTLQVVAANYKPYTADISLINLVNSNFSYDILLVKNEPVLAPVITKKEDITDPKQEEKVVSALVPPKEKPLERIISDSYFQNVEIGKNIPLEHVFFDQSQPLIKPQSYQELDRLVVLLRENPKISIEIIGHTDNVGDPRLNLYLSELRAKAVSNYLFNKGIAPDRLASTGKGQQQPVAANDTEESRQKNRRVEFKVLVN